MSSHGADRYKNPLFSDEFKKLAGQVIDEYAAETTKKIVGMSLKDAGTIAGGFSDEAMKKTLAQWRGQYITAVGAVCNDDVAGVVGKFLDGGAEPGGLLLPAIVMQRIAAALDAISLAHASSIADPWLAEKESELMAQIIEAGRKRKRSLTVDFFDKPKNFWLVSKGPAWYGHDASTRVTAEWLVSALVGRLLKGGYAVSRDRHYSIPCVDISW